MKYCRIILYLAIILFTACSYDYNNKFDPNAENYQGWPVYIEGESPIEWALSNASFEPNRLNWDALAGADYYEVKWAYSETLLEDADITEVLSPVYQFEEH